MPIRQPKIKDQAAQLRKQLEAKGLTLTPGESLELMAQLNGFSSWNVAKQAQRAIRSARDTRFPVKIWTVVHHHRHGEDSYLFSHTPSDEECIDRINSASSYEPGDGESFEVIGPETLVLNLPRQLLQQSRAKTPKVIQVYEICMTDLVEYDTPDTVPEWKWIQDLASFSHVGNNSTPGVWEFMVNAEKLKSLLAADEVPALLRHEVETALSFDVAWVMFHQG